MAAVTEERETMIQKGLSDWWSEETEYVLQRIERWAVFARGYNRLRSQRWSENRRMSQNFWNVSRNENAARSQSQFNDRTRRKLCPEGIRINCRDKCNYRSNGELDSDCLEVYWRDHSIYFQTIGDLRSGKKDAKEQRTVSENGNAIGDKSISERTRDYDNNYLRDDNYLDVVAEEKGTTRNVWPIVDLSKIDPNPTNDRGRDE